MKSVAVREYIQKHLMECTRENYVDNDTIIGLPFPYSVPCPDHFQELYYWDTYFLNLGLYRIGNLEQVRNNLEDFMFLIDRYGFIPNGSRTYYLERSQPPFFSMMVRDYFEWTKDVSFLKRATECLKKEREFWVKERNTPWGLQHYGINVPEDTVEKRYQICMRRMDMAFPESEARTIANHGFAMAESGWDNCPRFDFDAYHFVAVDLNSLLYALERNVACFSEILGDQSESCKYFEYAKQRKELMDQYLWNDAQGAYMDRNYLTGEFSKVFSSSSFFPLYVNLSDEVKAKQTICRLSVLEYPCGIVACEQNDLPGRYQWNYPNAWAPIQFVVSNGLANYGKTEDAQRIADKYMSTVESCFRATGALWEKYNALDGSDQVISEKKEKMPIMMGWTAGVYMWFQEHQF